MNATESAREPESNRLTTCLLPRCRKLFAVCGSCDRGRRYCSDGCSSEARRTKQRQAGVRYQATPEGRRKHAERQARYLERRRVTHQSSSPIPKVPANSVIDPEHAPGPAATQEDAPPRTQRGRVTARELPCEVETCLDSCCTCCGRAAVFLRIWPLRGSRARCKGTGTGSRRGARCARRMRSASTVAGHRSTSGLFKFRRK